jgi:hypothetical protein
MESNNIKSRNLIFTGVLVSATFTAIIAATSANLAGFQIVGKTVPFAYPWRLVDPTVITRLVVWGGYLLHNLIAWGIIYLAKRQNPKYKNGMQWFNWAMLATNTVFFALHIVQSQIWFDGLAQDVPEITALGSVALMLIVILILETPRRGLMFGKKLKFQQQFMRIVREYHGYLFSWAIIYDFWYHPTLGTFGHLAGFFYIFLLYIQATLIFNRVHLNKWWTFTLEFLVLVHGVAVAIFQGQAMWPMFAFGFGAMVVLTQMYGLGLNSWTKRGLAIGFIVMVVSTYAFMGRLSSLNEVIRIPVLDYMVVFLLYGLYLGIAGLGRLFKREPQLAQTGTD